MVLAPGFPAVNTASYWGLHCRERRSPDDVTRPKKPFEMTLRAPTENQGTRNGTLTGSKADNKKDSAAAPLLVTEFCSDSGFIEVALKCSVLPQPPLAAFPNGGNELPQSSAAAFPNVQLSAQVQGMEQMMQQMEL